MSVFWVIEKLQTKLSVVRSLKKEDCGQKHSQLTTYLLSFDIFVKNMQHFSVLLQDTEHFLVKQK